MRNKTSKKKKGISKGTFMKIIIVYCLSFIAITNIWALIILQKTGYNAYNIINAINAVHGGELLLCCVKRIMSGDNTIRNKSIKSKNSKKNNISADKDFLNNHTEDLRGDDTNE